MRQPNQRHRDPSNTPKPLMPGTRGGVDSATTQLTAEVVAVNGRGNDSSMDSMGSSNHREKQSPRGLDGDTRLGQAANPNRAEMPGNSRRKSYDIVVSDST